ncbi:hypothetical protein BD626DRAFT_395451 [Schizophyllum amplum]|uniref:Uncharacterized protein n=1 Tax=Schizophyllum amplum TaxID=97359 RepID=A0A550CTX5_9AGAR|nr:hypothetical protein BD626DRAFT_395451 [Auriculariopsis ampla]
MRLLPRLIKRLSKRPPSCSPELDSFHGKRSDARKSLYRPVSPRFNVELSHHAVSPVLADHSPFSHKSDYIRHKRLPPIPRLNRYKNIKPDHGIDPMREMSKEEREWFASPYLRMLATPLRRCAVTARYMPKDFLVRLLPMRLPESRTTRLRTILVPDGLEHPSFRLKRRGKGGYITCWRSVLAQASSRGAAGKIMHGSAAITPLLFEQTLHLLRVRVLQELDILQRALAEEHPKRREGCTTPIVRRLTRAELAHVRASGTIPYPNAIALVMCPPVNRHPVTHERPEGDMSAMPSAQSDSPMKSTATSIPTAPSATAAPARPPPPHSTLHPVTSIAPMPEGAEPHAPHLIPLYHSLTLFPRPCHRRKLHQLFSAIIAHERAIRPRKDAASLAREAVAHKASHAYLISSNAQTVARGVDVAAVGIALWRLRMLCGGGWNLGGQNASVEGTPKSEREPTATWTDQRELEGSRWCRTKW